ncbi:hypothetical protein EYS14_13215 [Alteromonadaceae bacterium M269]|nr:hypothetical protein EYS14_13215 [Alteromonadaceae bacterium M269]
MQGNVSFKIGKYTVNTLEHSLLSVDGTCELLQPKCIEVLYYLVKQYPNLVSREELIEHIWQGNNYVGEKALTNAIWNIRQKLHQEEQEYIQTVRKSGYRLVQEPTLIESEEASATQISSASKRAVFDEGILSWKLVTLSIVVFSFIYLLTTQSTPKPMEVESLTSSPGREVYAAVSPDGNFLVYFWRKIHENPDLYMKDLRQPDLAPVQLTFNSDKESRPVWGNSGDTLYFVQKSWNDDRCDIIEYDIQTKSQKSLAACRGDVNAALSISRDGKTLAFNSFDSVNASPGIYLLDLTKQDTKPVRYSCSIDCQYSDRDLVFSPNGKRYALTRRVQQYEEDIFIVDRASGESEQITVGQRDIIGMAWHPTQNKIIYSAQINDVRNGFIVDVETKSITDLGIRGFSYPSFVGDTSEVVFHDWQLNQFIASLNLAPDNVSVPFPLIQSEYTHNSPDYNGQSKQVTYISNESGNKEVWVSDWNGENRIQVTNLKSNIFYPRWSHNGNKIAFLIKHTASNKSSIKIVDVATKVIKEVKTDDFINIDMPTWVQGDESIIVQATKVSQTGNDSNSGFYSIDVASGHINMLIDGGGGHAIHTKDNQLWFTDDDEALYLADMNTNPPAITPIVKRSIISGEHSWLKTDDGVYYLQDYPDHQRIQYLSLADMEVRTLLRTPLRTIESAAPFTYSLDKNTLIFTEVSFPQVDIKKLNHPLLND